MDKIHLPQTSNSQCKSNKVAVVTQTSLRLELNADIFTEGTPVLVFKLVYCIIFMTRM